MPSLSRLGRASRGARPCAGGRRGGAWRQDGATWAASRAHVLALGLLWLLALPAGADTTETEPAAPETPTASNPEEGAREPWRLHAGLHAPEWLVLEGRFRARYSGLANQFRPGLDRDDQALSLRSLFTLGFRWKGLSVIGELQDSRAYLTKEDGAVSPIVVNAMELLQAYAHVRFDDVFTQGARLDVRAGRQTIDLGSRRLVARNRFRNTLQAYTGLTSRWQDARGSELTLLWLLPVTVFPSDKAALVDNRIELDRESLHLQLWGALYARGGLPFDTGLELYFFGLNESGGGPRPSADRQLYTPGLRLFREPAAGRWDFDVENTVQTGTRHRTTDPTDSTELRVRAHFHHVSGGYTWPVFAQPRVSAELDYGSGDAAGTARYERYDSLFGPRRAEFGPTGIYGPLGRTNTISTGLRLSLAPGERFDGFLSWRANLLEEPGDVFSSTQVQDPSGDSGRFAGHQLELRSRVWLLPGQLRGELGGAVLKPGPFLRDAPNANGFGTTLFIYADLEVFL